MTPTYQEMYDRTASLLRGDISLNVFINTFGETGPIVHWLGKNASGFFNEFDRCSRKFHIPEMLRHVSSYQVTPVFLTPSYVGGTLVTLFWDAVAEGVPAMESTAKLLNRAPSKKMLDLQNAWLQNKPTAERSAAFETKLDLLHKIRDIQANVTDDAIDALLGGSSDFIYHVRETMVESYDHEIIDAYRNALGSIARRVSRIDPSQEIIAIAEWVKYGIDSHKISVLKAVQKDKPVRRMTEDDKEAKRLLGSVILPR